MMMLTFLAYSVVAIQWILIGFSLAYSESSTSSFIGNTQYAFCSHIYFHASQIAPSVPNVVFACFEMQFAAFTGALVLGSMVKRVAVIPATAFIFMWTTVIYCPIVYWVWSYRGWARNMQCLNSVHLDSTPCGVGMIDWAGVARSTSLQAPQHWPSTCSFLEIRVPILSPLSNYTRFI